MKYFLDKTIRIRRLRPISGTIRSAYSATSTAYVANIQQPNPDRQLMYSDQIGKVFECFCELNNSIRSAREGDKVIQGSDEYTVRAVEIMDFGSTQYILLVIVKEK
jgi:hypothetical protein